MDEAMEAIDAYVTLVTVPVSEKTPASDRHDAPGRARRPEPPVRTRLRTGAHAAMDLRPHGYKHARTWLWTESDL